MSSTGLDARVLEEVMPFWLLEYLLINKIPPIPTVKISFVLLPYKSKDPNEEPLPELLNTYVLLFRFCPGGLLSVLIARNQSLPRAASCESGSSRIMYVILDL